MIQSFAKDMPLEKQIYYTGFALGITFGFILIMILFQAAHCFKQWLNARTGYKVEKLMLKYYDELKEIKKSNQ